MLMLVNFVLCCFWLWVTLALWRTYEDRIRLLLILDRDPYSYPFHRHLLQRLFFREVDPRLYESYLEKDT